MTHYNQLALAEILRNRENISNGIPNELPIPFSKMSDLIDGVDQECYYLIAGGTGSGKTKLADFIFVLNLINFVETHPNLPIRVNILYFSLEISGKTKAINLMSYYIFMKYGVELTSKQIRSKRGYVLTDNQLAMVMDAEKWVDRLYKYLTIYDTSLNANKFDNILKEYSKQNGVWTVDDSTKEEVYTPNNPYLYSIIMIDHFGLIQEQEGRSKKQEIDEVSRKIVWYKNKCRFTGVGISQYNRAIEDNNRAKGDVTPRLSDLKESGNPAEDANIVFAMFSPYRFRLDNYREYNTVKLKDRLRTISLLKNRDGVAELTLGFAFYGEIGLFSELKSGKEMTDEDYTKVLNYLKEWQTKMRSR